MATMTVSLPEPLKEWVDAQVEAGAYASTSDYVGDLIRRDREGRDGALTLEELRQRILDAKASGMGSQSVGDLLNRAKAVRQAQALPPA